MGTALALDPIRGSAAVQDIALLSSTEPTDAIDATPPYGSNSGIYSWDNTSSPTLAQPLNLPGGNQYPQFHKILLPGPGTLTLHDTLPRLPDETLDTVMGLYSGPPNAYTSQLVPLATDDDSYGDLLPIINYVYTGHEGWVYVANAPYDSMRGKERTTFSFTPTGSSNLNPERIQGRSTVSPSTARYVNPNLALRKVHGASAVQVSANTVCQLVLQRMLGSSRVTAVLVSGFFPTGLELDPIRGTTDVHILYVAQMGSTQAGGGVAASVPVVLNFRGQVLTGTGTKPDQGRAEDRVVRHAPYFV